LIYLDTSFVVSLYCPDANSTAAASLLQTIREDLLITTLVELETINALGLKQFRKETTNTQAEASLRNFDKAVGSGALQLRALPQSAFERARKMSRQFTPDLGTRTADLFHVVVALELGASSFYSFDLQQRKLAEAVGLTLNPLPGAG
jgi:predicted nucleic acid-binding protein